mgnify:CR=1 FL=1
MKFDPGFPITVRTSPMGFAYGDGVSGPVPELRTLDQIAGLRRRFFTLEEIRTMQTRPDRIGEVLTAYRAGLRTETQDRQRALSLAEALQGEDFPDLAALCRRLDQEAGRLDPAQLDIRPDFRRLDGDSPEEREAALSEWSKQEQKRKKKVLRSLRPGR